MPVVTAHCWLPTSTMPSDCLAPSPASQVVSVSGRPLGDRTYLGGEHPSQREQHVQRPGSRTDLGCFGQLARERVFCSLLPSPGWWSLLLDWWVIQPVNKHLQLS